MNIWEIIILVIVGSICIFGGIGAVYASIVNTVERYQVKRENRKLQIFTTVMGQLPELFVKIIDVVDKKEQEYNKNTEKIRNDIMEKVKEMDSYLNPEK